jgi:hypothetical protein
MPAGSMGSMATAQAALVPGERLLQVYPMAQRASAGVAGVHAPACLPTVQGRATV